jgi:hypothetical protein
MKYFGLMIIYRSLKHKVISEYDKLQARAVGKGPSKTSGV